MKVFLNPMKSNSALLLAAVVLSVPACDTDEEEEGETNHASVVEEEGIQVLVLTDAQEKSLGIRTDAAGPTRIVREIERSGWVEARPGAAASVKAPCAVTLGASGPWSVPGRRVAADEGLAVLRPVLAPADRIAAESARLDLRAKAADIEGEITAGTAVLEAAGTALARAEQLLEETAGSRKGLEEARARRAEAEARLQAAREKKKALDEVRGAAGALPGAVPEEIPLRSPLAGTVLAVRASPGEYAEAGSVVVEVADLDPVWIRVPVFAGELGRIDRDRPVRVEVPSGGPGTGEAPGALETSPVARAAEADPGSPAVSLWFSAPNPDGRLPRGLPVAVRLPTREPAEALTIPESAVVLAPDGTAWTYVARGGGKYARRRVETGSRSGDRVEVLRGLRAGEKVVAAGAPELFGSEFGAGIDQE